MMIQSRLRARERRQEAQKTWRVWRDDMLMEEWFWGELGVLKREGEEGNVEVASWCESPQFTIKLAVGTDAMVLNRRYD